MASDDAAVTISAPRLETLACADACRPDRLRLDGAATVRRLDKIFLWSHGRPGVYSNAGAVWLLQHCTAANSLGVHISPPVVCTSWMHLLLTSIFFKYISFSYYNNNISFFLKQVGVG